MADGFCRLARRRIRSLFRQLWSNDDVAHYRLGVSVLEGRQEWLETGLVVAPGELEARPREAGTVPVGA